MNAPDYDSFHQAPDYLLAKSEGNPYHDKKTGRFSSAPVDGDYSAWLPPSDNIKTLAEAKNYYDAHLAGIWTITINRSGGIRRVKVNMNDNQWHAYTKTVGDKRVFWPERAQRMSAIINAIANPGVVLENGSKDLFLERVVRGDHDVVVLEWRPNEKEYRFRSYHYWLHDEFVRLTKPTSQGGYNRAKMRGVDVQKVETPIKKSIGASFESSSQADDSTAFTNLHRTSLADSCEFGEAHTGIGWPHDANILYAAELVKSIGTDVIILYQSRIHQPLEKSNQLDFSSITGPTYRASHEPSPAKLRAGNYAKRKLQWNGLTISIENEAGSVRRGFKPDGSEWQTRMIFPYCYVNGSLGLIPLSLLRKAGVQPAG